MFTPRAPDTASSLELVGDRSTPTPPHRHTSHGSACSSSTGFERTLTVTVAGSTCLTPIKPARARRSVPTSSSRRAVRPRSPARRGASTSAATSTKAGPPCPSGTRPRPQADPSRGKTRSESSPSRGSRSGRHCSWHNQEAAVRPFLPGERRAVRDGPAVTLASGAGKRGVRALAR